MSETYTQNMAENPCSAECSAATPLSATLPRDESSEEEPFSDAPMPELDPITREPTDSDVGFVVEPPLWKVQLNGRP